MDELSFEGNGAIQLCAKYWDTKSPKAILLIVHGFGEHGGRYSGMAEYMQSCGIAVMAPDNRGHGLSQGKRGLILHWEDFREDLKVAVNILSAKHPAVPLFMLGHSVGGTIVLDYTQSADVAPRGVIASAPALGTPGLSPILIAFAKVMSAIAPKFIVNLGLDSNAISRNPEECSKYRDDPLVHDKACVRLSTELTSVQKRIFSRAGQFPSPLLLSYGSSDSIAPREPIESFHNLVGTEDRKLQIFDGAFHEIHNDTIRDDVYRLYSEWILSRA